MKKCIIIGGGLAGLSAAVSLLRNSHKIILLESSPKLGGRAYSLFNGKHNHFIDNGQHIMMGCYKNTLDYIKNISALNEIEFQESLRIPFVNGNGEINYLDAGAGFYPYNLLSALMNYKALTPEERFSVIRFFIFNIYYNADKPEGATVAQWLRRNRQTQNAISNLWEILAVGTLNSSIDEASAKVFRDVLRIVFFSGRESSKIVLPKNSLGHSLIDNAEKFILENGGEIHLHERVGSISLNGNKVASVNTAEKVYSGFDAVISAVPLNSFEKIIFYPNKPEFNLPKLTYSPIITLHLWLDQNPFKEKFYGFSGSPIHWLFNHGTHISLLTSAAKDIISLSKNEIIGQYYLEIRKFFPFFVNCKIIDSIIIKEKCATFVPDVASDNERRNIFCPVNNMFLSGDWIDTKLPATIEGAIKSGLMAAEAVMKD